MGLVSTYWQLVRVANNEKTVLLSGTLSDVEQVSSLGQFMEPRFREIILEREPTHDHYLTDIASGIPFGHCSVRYSFEAVVCGELVPLLQVLVCADHPIWKADQLRLLETYGSSPIPAWEYELLMG